MTPQKSTIRPETFSTFGDLLRYLRERAELSQRELALQVGYHYSYLSRLEKNVRIPDQTTLLARFIPALGIEDEPEWTSRLLALADVGASAPQETYEIESEALTSGFPFNPHPLLGRERETAEIIEIISTETRLLTLIGPPGVGKTRLAVAVAERLSGEYAHGSLFVDLAPVSHSDQVPSVLMQALGIHEAGHGNALERIKGRLSDENLLMVFDNFEQVVDSAWMVNQLLAHARGVKILVTSREALKISGEVEYQVKPLPLPDRVVSKNEIAISPAVQLFVERAHDVKNDFSLTDNNAAAIVSICQIMDGLPLAIELAAARVNVFTPQVMLNQMDRRFEWLTRGGRDIQSWRRTLSGAVEWSYQLLNEKEKTLLCRLSVFSGGWSLASAESVCAEGQVLSKGEVFPLLLQLTEKSLVVAEEHLLEPRWHMLETLRQFSHERLEESGDLEIIQTRHLACFTNWAEEIAAQLDLGVPLDFHLYLEKELNNLRTALKWGYESAEHNPDGFRLYAAFSYIALEYGLLKEGEEWVRRILPLSNTPENRFHRAALLHRGAYLIYLGLWYQGLDDAYAMVKEAEQLARSLDDKRLLASVIYHQYEILADLKKLDEAHQLLIEGIAVCREIGYHSQLNSLLTALGVILYKQGKYEESMQSIDEAYTLAIRTNDDWGQAFALRTKGKNLRLQRRYAEASEAFLHALDVARKIGDRFGAGTLLENLSVMANVLEDARASEKYALESFVIFQTIGNDYQQPFSLRMMAYASLQLGNLVRARELCLDSLRRNASMGEEHRIGIYGCLVLLAELALQENHPDEAVRLCVWIEEKLGTENLTFQEADDLALKRVRIILAEDLPPTQKYIEWLNTPLDQIVNKYIDHRASMNPAQ